MTTYQSGGRVYFIYDVSEISDRIVKNCIWRKGIQSHDTSVKFANSEKQPKQKYYTNISMGFDIETTNYTEWSEDEKGNSLLFTAKAYMYHWQLSLNDIVITGRKWTDFETLLYNLNKWIKHNVNLSGCKKVSKTIIWVANLSFEFEFIKKRFKLKDVFAKDKHDIVKFSVVDYTFEFRDALNLSGGSLESLAKDYCKTQKLVGDLDYRVLRNSQTELSEKEKEYCYNDVIILSEFHDFIYSQYIEKNYLPYTKTGVLRHEVKKLMTAEDFKSVWDNYPNEHEYKFFMNYVYKGGYAHACAWNVSELLLNEVYSVDYTSSYPAVMEHELYPMSAFLQLNQKFIGQMNEKSIDEVQEYFKKRVEESKFTIVHYELYDVKNKTFNTYISASKCINEAEILNNKRNTTIDNGRILECKKCECADTEIDMITIFDMYTFSRIVILNMWECENSGRLPNYLLQPLEHFYQNKAELKSKGLESTAQYAIAKAMVNSTYGMCCQKMIEYILEFKDGDFDEKLDLSEWDKKVKKQFLLPYWGIYICAYARRNLMKFVVDFDDDTVCCDTDSIYFTNIEMHRKTIDDWNYNIIQQNIQLFNNPAFNDLGCFDFQSIDKNGNITPYEKFCTMGAKRYLLCGWNNGKYGYKQTIAGLPKGVLIKTVEKYNIANKSNIDVFDVFRDIDGFEICRENAHKLTTHYNPEPHSDIINGELMTELSSVCIFNIPFSLTLANNFRLLVCQLHNTFSGNKEKRKF